MGGFELEELIGFWVEVGNDKWSEEICRRRDRQRDRQVKRIFFLFLFFFGW